MSNGSVPAAIEPIVTRAIGDRVFPGAVIEAGRSQGPLFTFAAGALSYDAGSPSADPNTIYDLASLTKVLATAAIVAGEVSRGRMRLDDPVRHWIESWTGDERQSVTIRELLEHSSGLPGHRRYFESRQGRPAFETAICKEPLVYPPRTESVYSDPGFMLLGFAIENAADGPLDRRFETWCDREIGAAVELRYRPGAEWRDRIAPTENDPSGEARRGEVHDENAAALGGVAAHAGLFGYCRGRRRLRALVDALTFLAALCDEDNGAEEFARAWLGHHAPHFILRHENVRERDWPHRFHRYFVVDRSRE